VYIYGITLCCKRGDFDKILPPSAQMLLKAFKV